MDSFSYEYHIFETKAFNVNIWDCRCCFRIRISYPIIFSNGQLEKKNEKQTALSMAEYLQGCL